ncbi:type II/IV secretion system protein [Candidatus Dependentiae bacterium]|nr:type II/IV secretion system protein [Candidatus Dependentiae bacterium]
MIRNSKFLELLDKNFVKENLVFPYDYDEKEDVIKIASPSENKSVISENLSKFFDKKIETLIFPAEILDKVIDEYYLETIGGTEIFQKTEEEAVDDSSFKITSEIKKTDLLYDTGIEEPAIKLVNKLIINALIDNATDIHIEPAEQNVAVRYRIVGILYQKNIINKQMQPSLTARIKILSNLDISESRLPQDGSFQVSFAGKTIDFRVSTIPINHGERIVLRILDKTKFLLKLENTGMDEYTLNLFRKKINFPNGIILVTGPTGSGKTTTLYGALNELKTGDRNIITIEDPVEYQIQGINQIQVKPEIGLDFSAGLRSILRQDPDIIMVGEIRDEETMNIAIQSSLTGHLVFSTLHTNDSISTVVRLYNMGLKPYLISSSVICVIAQRLVKLLCPECKRKTKLAGSYIGQFNLKKYIGSSDIEIYEENGCEHCKNTGYSGRKGIFEILNIDAKIKEMIMQRQHPEDIKKYCETTNMRFLIDNAAGLFLSGRISLKELLSVVSNYEI